jgi:hypothetical protein
MDVVFLPHLRMCSLRWAYKYLTFSRPADGILDDAQKVPKKAFPLRSGAKNIRD